MNLISFALMTHSAPAQSDVATPRTDKNSQIAHEQMVDKAKKGRIDLYFVGDSITRRWGTSDAVWKDMYANWKENFWGWNAGNFGWGADSTQNILWRMQNGELDNVNPKVIVLLAGTNNISGGESPENVAKGVKAIFDTCRSKAPNATIIVTGILPRNDKMDYIPVINAANELIKKFARGRKTIYVNANSKLADKDGKLVEGVTIDNLHLSVKGYQIWADALNPHLKRLLGKKAEIDLAPPPTGDPSQAPKKPGGL